MAPEPPETTQPYETQDVASEAAPLTPRWRRLWESARPTVLETCRLVRLPLVFTTTGDVLVGYLVNLSILAVGRFLFLAPLDVLLAAVLCSAMLYLFGMAMNDIVDRERDREIHPDRPIPSGRLSVTSARATAATALAGGLGIAIGRGPLATAVALLMVTLIVLYNGLLKRWAIPGSVAMGSIRGLNILLGWAFFVGANMPDIYWYETWFKSLADGGLRPALFLAAYIALVTFLSTAEEKEQRWTAIGSLTAILALLFWLKWPVLQQNPDPLLPMGLIIFWRWVLALMDHSREVIGQHVRFLLLGIFLLDAHFLFMADYPQQAAFVMVLLLPALALGRLLRVSS